MSGAPVEWSIGDVVRHLLAAKERVFLPRLERMIAETRPTFAPIDDVLASACEPGPPLDADESATHVVDHGIEHLAQITGTRAVIGA